VIVYRGASLKHGFSSTCLHF